jgi:hypothetical protein
MNPSAKDRLGKQVQKLIAEGQTVLTTKFSRSGGGYIDMSDPYVDAQKFHKWVIGCSNLVSSLGDSAKAWSDAFGGDESNQFVIAQVLLGKLEALKEAIDGDLLVRVEDLVMADAFADLLEQADELLEKGYLLAAGVLGRAVLEEHLRKLCDRQGCLPSAKPTIHDLNQALYKTSYFDKLTMKQVDVMATAGNHCAHNTDPPLTSADVRQLLTDVAGFLQRHPLS